MKKKISTKKILLIILLCVILPFVVRIYFIQPYKMAAGSMEPTFKKGDMLLVNKTVSTDSIKRGDIVLSKFPEDPRRDFVKRVIGVGGDTIESKDKKIYINGIAMEEPYVQYIDKNIRSNKIEPRDNFGPFVIPVNHYFVMGDNRD